LICLIFFQSILSYPLLFILIILFRHNIILTPYINGIEGFWSYAKEKLLKFYGVSKDNFIYYLKELEFRYNFMDNVDDSLYKCLGGIN